MTLIAIIAISYIAALGALFFYGDAIAWAHQAVRRFRQRPPKPSMSIANACQLLDAAVDVKGLSYEFVFVHRKIVCDCEACTGPQITRSCRLVVAIPKENRAATFDLPTDADIEPAVNLALGAINGWRQMRAGGEKLAKSEPVKSDSGAAPIK